MTFAAFVDLVSAGLAADFDRWREGDPDLYHGDGSPPPVYSPEHAEAIRQAMASSVEAS